MFFDDLDCQNDNVLNAGEISRNRHYLRLEQRVARLERRVMRLERIVRRLVGGSLE